MMESTRRALVVDDDTLFRSVVRDRLAQDGLDVLTAPDLATARRQIDDRCQVVILDQCLPDGDGLDFVRELREAGHEARVLMVTGHPEVGDAVEALRLRIDDYLTKPVELEVLRHATLRSLETRRLEQVERLATRRVGQRPLRLVGAGLTPVRRLVEIAAGSASPVLITGPTGSGKGLVAAVIHQAMAGQPPFIKVNCAALPPNLIEAELFGVEKGAYTGADQSRDGLFELADGGVLFLDEIGELDPAMQAKLLAALEDGAIRRLGGARDRPISVRVLAATNRDLEAAIGKGSFRADLFYRLNVLRIETPSLAARVADLPELVAELLPTLAGGLEGTLAPGELDRLAGYSWPGNVRELRNVLERSLLLHAPEALEPSRFLSAEAAETEPLASAQALPAPSPPSLRVIEDRHIRQVLEHTDGNRTEAARILEIGLATLKRRLRARRDSGATRARSTGSK